MRLSTCGTVHDDEWAWQSIQARKQMTEFGLLRCVFEQFLFWMNDQRVLATPAAYHTQHMATVHMYVYLWKLSARYYLTVLMHCCTTIALFLNTSIEHIRPRA